MTITRRATWHNLINPQPYSLKTIPLDACVVCIGQRRKGKSFLIRDIMYHLRKAFKWGVVFCESDGAARFYQEFIPDTFIYDKYDSDTLARIFEIQKRKSKKAIEQNLKIEPIFIIVDDLLDSAGTWTKCDQIKKVFFNGRHYGIFFIVGIQYGKGIPPSLRSNADIVFMFEDAIANNLKINYENYCGKASCLADFKRVMEYCTGNYKCMVSAADNTRFSIYKAVDHPPFRVGSPQFWDYHRSNYNEKHDDPLGQEYPGAKSKDTLDVYINHNGRIVDYKVNKYKLKKT